MNESKSNVPNMYQTIPAVAALNHVPGFEPIKLLRPAKSRKGNEVVMKLALPYKKLWFRLAHPKGRIQVNRLKITEQMAIYEAQVYLDRSDTEPISSFTASSIFNSAIKNDYIKEAQEEAIDEALSIAGFGLQFADVEMTKEAERFGSEVPVSAIPAIKPVNAQTISKPTVNVQPKPQQSVKPVVNNIPVARPMMKSPEPVEDKLPIEAVEETELPVSPVMESKVVSEQGEEVLPVAPVETAVEHVQSAQSSQDNGEQDKLSATQRAMQILQGRVTAGNVNTATPTTAAIPEEVKEAVSHKYTRNTPVPKILKLMTFEEAQNVVVDVGTCVGKTIQEVADTRPAVLKYYQFGGYKGGNNILIAAATIMYNHLESQKMKKAG